MISIGNEALLAIENAGLLDSCWMTSTTIYNRNTSFGLTHQRWGNGARILRPVKEFACASDGPSLIQRCVARKVFEADITLSQYSTAHSFVLLLYPREHVLIANDVRRNKSKVIMLQLCRLDVVSKNHLPALENKWAGWLYRPVRGCTPLLQLRGNSHSSKTSTFLALAGLHLGTLWINQASCLAYRKDA